MKKQEDGIKEIKRRFQCWVKPSTLELVCRYMEDDNCSSQSEFIEKAVLFYTGYLSAKENKNYLPKHLAKHRFFLPFPKASLYHGTVYGINAPNTAPHFESGETLQNTNIIKAGGIAVRCEPSRGPYTAPTLSPASKSTQRIAVFNAMNSLANSPNFARSCSCGCFPVLSPNLATRRQTAAQTAQMA